MSILLTTIAIAFFIVAIAIALLGVGWLLTGKSKLEPGACGRNPHHKKDKSESCGSEVSCQLCEHSPHREKKTIMDPLLHAPHSEDHMRGADGEIR